MSDRSPEALLRWCALVEDYLAHLQTCLLNLREDTTYLRDHPDAARDQGWGTPP